MRDPSLDKEGLENVTSELVSSVGNATVDEAPTVLPGLDYEIEHVIPVPEFEESPFGQYVKNCPLCKGAVRHYFMNFNEKVVMCENPTCSWPFGYEELEYLKHDEALSVDEEVESLKVMSYGPVPPTGSIISTAAWSEMERSKGLESEEPYNTPRHQSDAYRDAKLQEVLKQKEADLQTKKNLQDIKKLNMQLQKTYEDEEEISCIRNEKWIQHLNNLQTTSGIKLLRDEEMALLKYNKPQGVTMDIDMENTCITINLAPSNSEEPKLNQSVTKISVTELDAVESTVNEPVIMTSSAEELEKTG